MVNPGPFPETLPVTGSLAVAVLQPVVPGLTAANDNDEPEPPGAAAAPVPRIGLLFLFDLSEIFRPALRVAAA
jgi:hypothetical protein